MCFVVNCTSLTDPDNGMINCSLGDNGIPSYEDTCSFTCNTGYELTGSDTKTCQSDGSWSGSDDVCRRSMYKTIVCYNYNRAQDMTSGVCEKESDIVNLWFILQIQV